MDNKNLKAGSAVLAIAAVLVVGGYAVSRKLAPGSCELTAAGIGLVATHFKQGNTAAVIIATVGAVGATSACQALVKKLEAEPTTPQQFELSTPQGPLTQSVTLPDLTATPPPPPPQPPGGRTISELIACAQKYTIPFLREMCYRGEIDPTP